MAKSKKPRIEAREVSIFGEVDQDLLRDDQTDIFEMPGYSDKRRQLELDRRAGRKWDPLNFRVQLVPVQKQTGHPDYTRVSSFQRRGYKLASPDELEGALDKTLWDERGHPTAGHSYTKGPDGTVRLSEYAVMICDKRRAAANLADVERRNREQQESGSQRKGLSKDGLVGWTEEEDEK